MFVGVTSVAVDHGVDTVLVETTLPSQEVLEMIESTGRVAVLRGMGSSNGVYSYLHLRWKTRAKSKESNICAF